METQSKAVQSPDKLSGIIIFFKRLGSKITGLFEPEEVEVTFEVKGKSVNYTYTKVHHKQVA